MTNYCSILPVSVIDVEPVGKTGIRGKENHDGDSSRKNFSPFPVSIATLCTELFLRDCSVVVDPFAGWGQRGAAIQEGGKRYVGFDTSPDAINACARLGVEVTQADSRVVVPPRHDGLLTCPPYWNLEKYAAEGLHTTKTWEQFCGGLFETFLNFRKRARPGATYCVMVGDWRSKGRYYDLVYRVERMFRRLEMVPHDKVIVSRKQITKIKIMLPQAKRLGYTVKVHENLLVYKVPE